MGEFVGIDFLELGSLPAPRISDADAERIAREHWDLAVDARSLGSQQDANFLLTAADGTSPGVLRVSNPAFADSELEAQDAASALLAGRFPEIRVPLLERPWATADIGGRRHVCRLLTYLPGGTLEEHGYLSPPGVAGLGRLSARTTVALRDLEHPGLSRRVQWDLRWADRVVSALLTSVDDVAVRALVEGAVSETWPRVVAHADSLPRQAIHHDVTDSNVVVRVQHGVPMPDGVLDFGDLTHSWAVADLATTITSLLHHPGAEPHSVLPAVRAYHDVRPLLAEEVEVLWSLVVMRAAALVVSGHQQAALDGAGSTAAEAMAGEQLMLERALQVPEPVMTALMREALGRPADTTAHPIGSLLPSPAAVSVLDLGWDADAMDDGAWLSAGLEQALAAQRLADGAPVVVTRFAEPRLTRSRALAEQSPPTVPTGIDLWLRAGGELVAPWDGAVLVDRDGLALAGGEWELRLGWDHGVIAVGGGDVLAGMPLLVVEPAHRVRVTVAAAAAGEVPAFVRPEYAAGWRAVVADPGPLLGLPPVSRPAPDELLARRAGSLADVQEHYYSHPPRIERGWRHHLIDTGGRAYLDMVNNVAVLGHSHPAVAEAASRQLRMLNTNSRFHYAPIVELSERLVELLPDGLDTVFLVNSGSEAADLALRLAMAATGRHDVVAVTEAYHGWTYLSDAVSTSTADNPQALETRPPWVHALESPNAYRGRHRGSEAWRYAGEAVERIDAWADSGQPPAALIAEAFYGNAGGVPLPDGYLAAVYAAVRRHGGLAIADEVQVGYGRLGSWFWGFEQQGVVPDIVCVAKAMGNGHPLGAVITTREVAERYRTQGYFFSSTGGSPVSCAVGLAVLDALRDEDLPANAAAVGGRLKAGLEALAHRHPIIGAVHGEGLYLGVELVRDRETLEPATEEAFALCDRLLELGVVVQPTSDRLCVLKIKPPLCLDAAAADFFVDMLNRALSDGW